MAKHRVREGRLEFEMEVAASVKWDDSASHSKHFVELQNTKAVDIAVLLDDQTVVLIEAKDFRGHRVANKARKTTGELGVEVAGKARDSLAGLTWAARRALDPSPVSHAIDTIAGSAHTRSHPKLQVVLWMEEDQPAGAAELDALRGRIETALRPIPAKVIVTSRALEQQSKHPLSWLKVKSVS